MKKSHFFWWLVIFMWSFMSFWWIFGWDWGTPTILRQNPNIYGQFQGKLSFGQFWKKKLGLGQIPIFYRKFVLGAPLSVVVVIVSQEFSAQAWGRWGTQFEGILWGKVLAEIKINSDIFLNAENLFKQIGSSDLSNLNDKDGECWWYEFRFLGFGEAAICKTDWFTVATVYCVYIYIWHYIGYE